MTELDHDIRADGSQDTRGGRRSWVVRGEEVLFLSILVALLAAGLLPIAARALELPALLWLDDLSEQMVLWTALFGAGAATRDRKHIDIDVIGRLLPPRLRLGLRAAMELGAAVLCGVLVPVGIGFARDEAEFAGEAETFLELCAGWLPAVIPFGLALLALRLLLAAVADARRALVGPREVGPA